MSPPDDVSRQGDPAAPIENLSRREFVQAWFGLGCLVLASGWAPEARAAGQKYGADLMPHGVSDNPRAFVAIAPDGTVSIYCHRSEMGQGVRTSLPLVVADELDADWGRVKVLQAPADEVRFGNQDTDGSRSLRHFFEPMRRCGAAARQMLEAAAAARWSVPVGEVMARNHRVVHDATGRSFDYGELAAAAARLPVPRRQTLRLKASSEFRYIGKGELGVVDAGAIVSGAAIYGIDIQLPGLLHAVIARPPVLGGRVRHLDSSRAMKIAGVKRIVRIAPVDPPPAFNPLGGVAVIADSTWAARQGRDALDIVWEDGPNGSYDSGSYRTVLEAAARAPGKVVYEHGSLDSLPAASRRVVAEYYLPHLAHATMEPPAATARIHGSRCEVWGGFQSPQGARDLIAQRLGIAKTDVTVHVPLIGGGFGRKSKSDFGVEAAVLSRAMNGAPVKVTWTREDDLCNGYYHTVSVERLEAVLDEGGRPVGWLHRSVAPSIESTFDVKVRHEAGWELGMGALPVAFDIPHVRVENPGAQPHTRIGWFRSVSNIPHAFAVQSFVAELAAAAGRDHRDYLLDLIGPARIVAPAQLGDAWNYDESPSRYPVDTGRLRGVIDVATRAADWGRTLPPGHGLGLAVHYSFMSYVAAVLEVSVDDQGQVRVLKADIAVDCGACVNPDRVRSQLEGACVMGIGVALYNEISFSHGRVQQTNLDTYLLPRMTDAPASIRVHIAEGDFGKPLGGVGEPGVPPIAPALCNAIHAATGKRIRALPVADQLRASGR